ncbi:hypothetical protein Bbelb_208850 [Branchiostoma belcheri]|nr:hypothetical protein Bbelb_208850 [Branchiostoma belcheri]
MYLLKKHERSPSGSRQEPARDLTAARPNCKSRSAPYHTPHGSRRATDRAPDGSLTETGRKIRRTLGDMTPAGVYAEDMPNGRRFKCDLSITGRPLSKQTLGLHGWVLKVWYERGQNFTDDLVGLSLSDWAQVGSTPLVPASCAGLRGGRQKNALKILQNAVSKLPAARRPAQEASWFGVQMRGQGSVSNDLLATYTGCSSGQPEDVVIFFPFVSGSLADTHCFSFYGEKLAPVEPQCPPVRFYLPTFPLPRQPSSVTAEDSITTYRDICHTCRSRIPQVTFSRDVVGQAGTYDDVYSYLVEHPYRRTDV